MGVLKESCKSSSCRCESLDAIDFITDRVQFLVNSKRKNIAHLDMSFFPYGLKASKLTKTKTNFLIVSERN